MVDAKSFFKAIKKNPDQYFIVHYSSEMLFDENLEGFSPRVTSIVVMHYPTSQTQSFACHLSADLLNIAKDQVDSNLDRIEADQRSELQIHGPDKFVRREARRRGRKNGSQRTDRSRRAGREFNNLF